MHDAELRNRTLAAANEMKAQGFANTHEALMAIIKEFLRDERSETEPMAPV